MWALVCSIRNSTPVNRVLLKNGKRSLTSLKQSRCNTILRHSPDEEGVLPPDDTVETFSALGRESVDSQVRVQERPDICNDIMSSNSLSDDVFKSTVLSGLSSLKSELAEVKLDLRHVEQRQVNNSPPQCAAQNHPCLLYLRLSHAHDSPLGRMVCRFF